jgi:hypothetical protein
MVMGLMVLVLIIKKSYDVSLREVNEENTVDDRSQEHLDAVSQVTRINITRSQSVNL